MRSTLVSNAATSESEKVTVSVSGRMRFGQDVDAWRDGALRIVAAHKHGAARRVAIRIDHDGLIAERTDTAAVPVAQRVRWADAAIGRRAGITELCVVAVVVWQGTHAVAQHAQPSIGTVVVRRAQRRIRVAHIAQRHGFGRTSDRQDIGLNANGRPCGEGAARCARRVCR